MATLEKDEVAEIATLEALYELGQASRLGRHAWSEASDWATLPLDRRDLLDMIDRVVERIAARTEWGRDVVLWRLGCQARQTHERERLPIEQLERCREFIAMLDATLLAPLTHRDDARRVLFEVRDLYRVAGFEIERMHRALDFRAGPSDLSALDFVGLGELSAAFATYRQALRPDAPGSVRFGSPLPRPCAPHIGRARIHAAYDFPELLGAEIAERIFSHLAACGACAEAAGKIRAADRAQDIDRQIDLMRDGRVDPAELMRRAERLSRVAERLAEAGRSAGLHCAAS